MTSIERTFVLGVAVIGLALPSYGSLLTNGSFEDGNFVPDPAHPGDDTMSLAVGATDMTGWTVQIAPLAWIGPFNPFGLSASDGSFFLDLSGYHDSSPFAGVLQASIPTTIGTTYRLTFDIGTDTRYDSAAVGIVATAGIYTAPFLSTPVGLNQWEEFTFDFVATSATTTISLDGQPGANQAYLGLDNVTFIVVPEPSTLSLIAGPGLLVFAAWRRFRKA